MRLLRNSILGVLVLAAIAVALTPKAVLAAEPIDGTFTVTFMRPSAMDYCGGTAGTSIEARGIGSVSKLGPLFLTVKKCSRTPSGGVVATYAGTFKMTAGNGDTLEGTYAGTQDSSLRDENGFGTFQGTLTFTVGTGSFRHITRGGLSFTAVSSPVSVGATAPTGNGMAVYLVQGTVDGSRPD